MANFPAFEPTAQVQNVTSKVTARPFPSVITSYDARQRNQKNMDFFNNLEQQVALKNQQVAESKKIFGFPPY